MVRGLPAGNQARDAWDCGKNVAAMVLAAHAAGVMGCAVHMRTPEVRLCMHCESACSARMDFVFADLLVQQKTRCNLS